LLYVLNPGKIEFASSTTLAQAVLNLDANITLR
jgi:hypothetical protein